MTPERWQRIEEIFHLTLEQPAAERAAFLERMCAGDATLRVEVESLLDQQDGSLLRDGIGADVAGAASVPGQYQGRRVGSCVLGPLLGVGGMGEVYRAHDEKLGRDVAVKILTAAFKRPDGLARLDREARVLASLNHPNIAAIYGVEETDGVRGLVLELVEGTTLDDKLRTGAMPVPDALGVARQIVDALEAAHEKGIVHRDLKPANIKVTPRGLVKVLDFGLARIETARAASLATASHLTTREGLVLGTIAYMSPEQARGEAVDARSDIWSFGCVLYEMLTGLRPFPGESSADVLGGIMRLEPDWSRLPANVPARIGDLLRRCLTKDPQRRLRDVADARLEIDAAIARGQDDAMTHPRRGRFHGSLAWIGATAAAGTAIAIWLAMRPPAERPLPTRLSIELPAGAELTLGRGSSVAVSFDGQYVVFSAAVAGRSQLYVRHLRARDFESRPIAGTEGGADPFFSPDGKWVGFLVGDEIRRVRLEGGTPLKIASGARAGAAWDLNDTIVFGSVDGTLQRTAASGGPAQPVTTLLDGEMAHLAPRLLPDGRGVVYTVWNNTNFDGARIALQPFDGRPRRVLVEGGAHASIALLDRDTAHLVYARPEAIMSAPLDLNELTVTAPAVPVLEPVETNLSGGAHFSLSPTGLLAYVPGRNNEEQKTALWVSRTGDVDEIGVVPGLGFQYRLARDGRLVHPFATGPYRDVWVDFLTPRRPSIKLTSRGIHNYTIWTFDGRRVIYAKGVPRPDIYWRAADGTGVEEPLTRRPTAELPSDVSRDNMLIYMEEGSATLRDLWVLPLDPVGEPRLFLQTPAHEGHPRISPNGRWVAFQSNVSEQPEVYLSAFPTYDRSRPISNGGGFLPMWSPDGRELYYRTQPPTRGGQMMAVSIDTSGREPVIGTPRELFSGAYQGDGDVAADGRFLLLKMTPQKSPTRVIQVVLNWFEELRASVAQR